MAMIKRLGILFLLLSLLIPTAALCVSGDGDIPEVYPGSLTLGDQIQCQSEQCGPSDMGHEWDMVWHLIVDVLSVLP